MQDPHQCTWARVLSLVKAQSMWSQWASSLPFSCPYLTDVVDNIQLIRIPTKTEVNWETSQMRADVLSAVTKNIKQPTGEQIDGQVAKLDLVWISLAGGTSAKKNWERQC